MGKEEYPGKLWLPTRNVDLLTTLVSTIANRPDPTLPGMGVFHGPTGYGKSLAVSACHDTHRVYYVQMRDAWTRRDLLEMVLSRMFITPERRIARMLAQVSIQLQQSGRPLIIDEADILVRKGMIELVRDIYESSQGTVVLVGEENLPALLEKNERVHGRILDWAAAQPASMADARMFAGRDCRGITVSDDLLERILEAARGSARYVRNSLVRVTQFARVHGLESMTAETYTGPLFTGKAPERRRPL